MCHRSRGGTCQGFAGHLLSSLLKTACGSSLLWLLKDLGLLQCVSRLINFGIKCLRLLMLLSFKGVEL